MANKNKTLGVRIDADMEAQLEELQKLTDIEATTLARHAMRAALEYYKRTGELTLPLACLPKREYESLAALAEHMNQ